MNWTQIFEKGCNAFIDWGPGMLIAALVLYGLYRFILKVGMKIVGALEKPTDALTMQAHSMDALTQSLREYVGRDKLEHKEIIILQKVILEEIERLRRDRDDRNSERALP
jgi:hypothetical protein